MCSYLPNSDSEDEEILFTKEMLKRLEKKNRRIDEEISEAISVASDNINKEADVKLNDASLNPKQIIPTTSFRKDDSATGKKYYFGKRFSEYNNLVRLLELKKEEAIWKEEYASAHKLEDMLRRIKMKEIPLKEMLIDRMDALEQNNLLEAQRLKENFDKNMKDILNSIELDGLLSDQEISRLSST